MTTGRAGHASFGAQHIQCHEMVHVHKVSLPRPDTGHSVVRNYILLPMRLALESLLRLYAFSLPSN